MENNVDWEHESQKDLIYLQEDRLLLEQIVLKNVDRKPAIINIVDEDKILNKNEQKNIVLPF